MLEKSETLPPPPLWVLLNYILSDSQDLEGKLFYGTGNKKYFHLINGIVVTFYSKVQRGNKRLKKILCTGKFCLLSLVSAVSWCLNHLALRNLVAYSHHSLKLSLMFISSPHPKETKLLW